MAKKFYAVKNGRVPGIYETWAECREQISGFSGAVYRGFASRGEAETFLLDGAEDPEVSCRDVPVAAYVDGSYDASTRRFSYGMVLFDHGQELHFSEAFHDEELAQMHNVAGELEGSRAAMQYCLDHDIPEITIYHDYEGIAKWCTGDWKAGKPGTIAYAEFYREVSRRVKIRFVKVKGHSGDRYNELADQLARKALGIG